MVLKKNALYGLFVLLVNVICYVCIYCISSNSDSLSSIKIIMPFAIVSFFIQFVLLAKLKGSFLSNYGLFIVAFVVFHFGLFTVYAFGGTYNYFYLNSYDASIVIKCFLYEYLCAGALFFVPTFFSKEKPLPFKVINNANENHIHTLGIILTIVTGLVAFVLIAIKSFVFFRGGYYEGVRQFESSVNSGISLIEYMFIPFVALTIIYTDKKNIKTILLIVLVLWSLLTAILGDRTSGIAGLLLAFLIYLSKKPKATNQKKRLFPRFIVVIILAFLTLGLIAFISSYRETGSFEFGSGIGAINDALGEMGSSYFPVVLIMNICPSKYGFLYGQSYGYSILSGFVPESIDFTGFISRWISLAFEPRNWISLNYDYTFGVGYSLCAESYANFGTLGFVAIFIIGCILYKLFISSNNKFSIYCSLILLFEYITLPRRNFYYVLNHFFYCVLMVALVIVMFCNKKEGKRHLAL